MHGTLRDDTSLCICKMRFFSWTNKSWGLFQARAVTGFADFFFFFSIQFFLSRWLGSFYSYKQRVALQFAKNCITYVLVIKQEIAERQRGLEKACDAKWTFYISRVLLSKISRFCICLSDASVWWCVWLCIGVWLMYNRTESMQEFIHCPAICV